VSVKRLAALASAVAVGLAAVGAQAQYDHGIDPGGVEYPEPPPLAPLPPPPPAPPASPPDGAPAPSHTAMHLSALGSYRSVFDIGLAGGGAAISIGGDYPLSGAFELRILGGRTLGGLAFADIAALGTAMARVGGGFELGLGIGLESLAFVRATNGDLLDSGGLAGLLRVRYDLGRSPGVFVDADCSFYYGGATVWGPTVGVGYRF
jgi:hypothetical protein